MSDSAPHAKREFAGPQSPQTIVLAHGAGAGMDSEFMQAMAEGLVGCGLKVVRFEFPYMSKRLANGTRRPPDREPSLRETWLDVIKSLTANKLIIGGKSMGGRIASLIADDAKVTGLVCLGYPFHPSGKPDRLRIEHLQVIKTPTLILQGERDPLGNKKEVARYQLSKSTRLRWLPDGDHSFKPRKRSGRSQEDNWNDAIRMVAEFAKHLAT